MEILTRAVALAAMCAAGCTTSVDIPCTNTGQCPTGSFCSRDGLCEEGGGQGVVQTVVGGGVGDGRPSEESILRDVSALAVDEDGTIYVAEFQHGRIRRIDPDGIISTIAGTGLAGSEGGLPGGGLRVQVAPLGLALDAQYIYYTDRSADQLRRIDKQTGIVESIVGIGDPRGVAVDPDTGLIYVADPTANQVYEVDAETSSRTTIVNTDGFGGHGGDTGLAAAADLLNPYGVAVKDGQLYISDDNRVRIVDLASGVIDRFAGGSTGSGGDDGPALMAQLDDPRHLAFDAEGNLLIADNGNNRVRAVDLSTDTITTVAGGLDCCFIAEGVAPTGTFLPQPEAVAGAPDGSVLVGDNRNNLLRRIAGGAIETIAGGASPVGDTGTDARINRPFGVEPDGEGGFYVVDPEASSVYQVSAGGTVSRIAGSGIRGFSGDGELATEALLDFPEDVAVDAQGNIYISDTGNDRVRRVDGATGIISTFAGGGTGADGGPANLAELDSPAAIEFHPSDGRLFIAERGAHKVRAVDTSGVIATIAGTGTPGTTGEDVDPLEAELNAPNGLAFDRDENLFIAERDGHVVRLVELSGDRRLRVLVGQAGVSGFCGDLGDGTAACLSNPHHLAIDRTTNVLYIADQGNHRIRQYAIEDSIIDSATGGGFGEGGDIESASDAELATPFGVSAIPGGGILIGNSAPGQVKILSN